MIIQYIAFFNYQYLDIAEYFSGFGDCTLYDPDRTVEEWQTFYATMNGVEEWANAVEMFKTEGRNMNYLYDRQPFQCIVARNHEIQGMGIPLINQNFNSTLTYIVLKAHMAWR